MPYVELRNGDEDNPCLSFKTLNASAARVRYLAAQLRSSAAPAEYIVIAEEAADLLTIIAAEIAPACEELDDPSPETVGVTWLGG